MGEEISNGSLEKTPTWAVAVFAFVFFFLAYIIETSLHHLAQVYHLRTWSPYSVCFSFLHLDVPNFQPYLYDCFISFSAGGESNPLRELWGRSKQVRVLLGILALYKIVSSDRY